MTSLRPDANQVWNFLDANPLSAQATPGLFKEHGYLSMAWARPSTRSGRSWNADAYWSTEVKPYFNYSTNKCPHGSEGGGHCTLADDDIWDYKLRLAGSSMSFAAETYRNTSRPFFMMVASAIRTRRGRRRGACTTCTTRARSPGRAIARSIRRSR